MDSSPTRSRTDSKRTNRARAMASAVAERVGSDGRYLPPEAFFPESAGYRGELAATLALAGHRLDEPGWIDTATRMFDRLLEERVDGMWSIGWWCSFPVYRPLPLEWKQQNAVPDPRYTALTLYSMSIIHRLTGEPRYLEAARSALASLVGNWDLLRQPETMHLTAEAGALALLGWEHEIGRYAELKERIIDWAASTFPEAAPQDFPFFSLIRMMLLVAASGTRYLRQSIRPAVDALLDSGRWRCPESSDDFRHITATDDHINVRGNGAVASIMRIHDLIAGETVYTGTELYAHLSSWMDEMAAPNGLSFGCMRFIDRMRYGMGSPAQYMQLLWMLGGFML